MNSEQLENDLKSLMEALDEESFSFCLLLAYGQPKASITRLQKRGYVIQAERQVEGWHYILVPVGKSKPRRVR